MLENGAASCLFFKKWTLSFPDGLADNRILFFILIWNKRKGFCPFPINTKQPISMIVETFVIPYKIISEQ
jgi:hypothetical protein